MRIAIVDIVTSTETLIDPGHHIEFGKGDSMITIMVRADRIEVTAKHRIVIYPIVTNVIIVAGGSR